MAPLEIRLDHAGATGPLYALGARNGSRPTNPTRLSQSEFWQLRDRSPATNRGLCKYALNWVVLEASPVPFVSRQTGPFFADCDEAGGNCACHEVRDASSAHSVTPAPLMMASRRCQRYQRCQRYRRGFALVPPAWCSLGHCDPAIASFWLSWDWFQARSKGDSACVGMVGPAP
jgi:hypothetical protein